MTGGATELLDLADARALLLRAVEATPGERVPLAQCSGRILADAVIAERNQPPEALSAMDGYAIRLEDAVAGSTLQVIGTSPAGKPFRRPVRRNQAVQIATGGVVPPGADHILIQENVTREGSRLRVGQCNPQAYIRPAGMDFAAGEVVLREGDELTPGRLALAGAANAGSLLVRRRPRVAIMPGGDELREPGEPLGEGEIVNSITSALAALVGNWGGTPLPQPILPDERNAAEAQLRSSEGLGAEVIVTLGGASVGERDCLRPAFNDLGADIVFHGIAVVPGKPCWHARFADGRLVLGLPGNPSSAFVCAHLLLKPLLWALTGRDPGEAVRPIAARLTRPLAENGRREAYLRAKVEVDGEGCLAVTPWPNQDSGMVTPLASVNSLLVRPIAAPVASTGEMAQVLVIGRISASSKQ
uniref:molybdopterin molybdotransferase MoeA n=1 Tax=uncultured Sphingomonas sp. TaxID=158754 RepID=UPI0025F45519|nr:molybdopterin molybdotransferase MoeA [uncultured Sphingomonas sp.]